MNHRKTRRKLNRIASFFSFISYSSITFLGAMLKAEDSKAPTTPCQEKTETGSAALAAVADPVNDLSWFGQIWEGIKHFFQAIAEMVPWVHSHAVSLIFGFALLALVAGVVKTFTRDSEFWNAIDDFLEAVRSHLFNEAYVNSHAQEPVGNHRVTLYVYRKWKWWIWPWRGRFTPWGWPHGPGAGWLVPVARTGHTSQRMRSIFLAPDNEKEAEGLVGTCWASMESPMFRDQLPDAEDNIDDYCKASLMPKHLVINRLKNRKSLPRALAAIPIRNNKSTWGVILLDSQRPDGIKSNEENPTAYTLAQKLTKKLLENSELYRKVSTST